MDTANHTTSLNATHTAPPKKRRRSKARHRSLHDTSPHHSLSRILRTNTRTATLSATPAHSTPSNPNSPASRLLLQSSEPSILSLPDSTQPSSFLEKIKRPVMTVPKLLQGSTPEQYIDWFDKWILCVDNIPDFRRDLLVIPYQEFINDYPMDKIKLLNLIYINVYSILQEAISANADAVKLTKKWGVFQLSNAWTALSNHYLPPDKSSKSRRLRDLNNMRQGPEANSIWIADVEATVAQLAKLDIIVTIEDQQTVIEDGLRDDFTRKLAYLQWQAHPDYDAWTSYLRNLDNIPLLSPNPRSHST